MTGLHCNKTRFLLFLWFLYFLQSMKFFYLQFIPGGIIGLIIFLYTFLFYKKTLNNFHGKLFLTLLIGIVTFCFSYEYDSILQYVNLLILPVDISILLCHSPLFKLKLIDYCRDGLFYILVPSLFFFLLYNMGVDIINIGNFQSTIYWGTNHLFFLYQPYYGIRFCSLFMEPGHIGMILAIVLYCENFNFKVRKNVFLLFCLFFTLSLAAYVLALVGYCFVVFGRKSIPLSKIVVIGFFTFLMIVLLYQIPTIRSLIFDRLLFDNDTNTIAGDNRINYAASQFWQNISYNELLFGIGSKAMDKYNLAGTGIFIHIMTVGLISVIFILLYYLQILSTSKINRLSIGLLIIYIISFYQRSYALWACELIMFVSYISFSSNFNGKNVLNNYSK